MLDFSKSNIKIKIIIITINNYFIMFRVFYWIFAIS